MHINEILQERPPAQLQQSGDIDNIFKVGGAGAK